MKITKLFLKAACHYIMRYNGMNLYDNESALVEEFIPKDISIKKLKGVIVKTLIRDKNLPDEMRCLSYFALGKLYNSELIPFFVERLKIEIERDSKSAYQIMTALDNLDQKIFSSNSNSIFNIEQNLEDAEKYLSNEK